MQQYNSEPTSFLAKNGIKIASFISQLEMNIDWKTVESFGNEWSIYDSFSHQEITSIGADYFDILPKQLLTENTVVLDAGCGSGRWSKYLSPKVGYIEAIDPSSAVYGAAKVLKDCQNVRVSQASIENIPFEDDSFDLVFSLGVLHHIPDTHQALKNCVSKVKTGGYFLVYLYYNLDNRGWIFKFIFKISNIFRNSISRLPSKQKVFCCNLIALFIYVPLAFLSWILEKLNLPKAIIDNIPLSYYRKTSLNIIKNDALDRFGTPLEQRFSRDDIHDMMKEAGLKDIQFSNKAPFWHAIGKKR